MSAAPEAAAVLLAGADVGCLEILLPLYAALEASRTAACAPYLCLPADSLARRRVPPGLRLLEETGFAAALGEHRRLACLASTPGKSQDLVRRVLDWSRQQGAPSVLAETVHLSSRYGGLGDLPVDLLVTLDRFGLELLARPEAARAPAGSVAALGQPAFDDLEARLAAREDLRRRLRRRAGLGAADPVLGFFASASSQADPAAVLDVLEPLLKARPQVELLAFAHPVDAAAAAGRRLPPSRLAPLLRDADELDRLALCDLVLTQFSTVGAKALYGRRPTVFALGGGAEAHLRRNGRLPCFESLAGSGAAAVARDAAGLAAALAPLLDDPAARAAMVVRQRARFPSITGSAERMARAVAALV